MGGGGECGRIWRYVWGWLCVYGGWHMCPSSWGGRGPCRLSLGNMCNCSPEMLVWWQLVGPGAAGAWHRVTGRAGRWTAGRAAHTESPTPAAGHCCLAIPALGSGDGGKEGLQLGLQPPQLSGDEALSAQDGTAQMCRLLTGHFCLDLDLGLALGALLLAHHAAWQYPPLLPPPRGF